jgi:hypothetical protein
VVADTITSGGLNADLFCAADFDGDGDIDLTVSNQDSANITVFMNNGDAIFAVPVFYPMGNWPTKTISADLNRDGDSDLVVTNNGLASFSVLLSAGRTFHFFHRSTFAILQPFAYDSVTKSDSTFPRL